MMQSLGRSYVRYYNYQYQRTGTLWERRYKSCLVQTGRYLLEIYRYLELNPVRAGVVAGPCEYNWSSYKINSLGQASDLSTLDHEYLALGADPEERKSNYRTLFTQQVDGKLLSEIRANTNKG